MFGWMDWRLIGMVMWEGDAAFYVATDHAVSGSVLYCDDRSPIWDQMMDLESNNL